MSDVVQLPPALMREWFRLQHRITILFDKVNTEYHSIALTGLATAPNLTELTLTGTMKDSCTKMRTLPCTRCDNSPANRVLKCWHGERVNPVAEGCLFSITVPFCAVQACLIAPSKLRKLQLHAIALFPSDLRGFGGVAQALAGTLKSLTLCKFQGYGSGPGIKYSVMDKTVLFQAIAMLSQLHELTMPELGEFVGKDEDFVLDPLLSMDNLEKVFALSVQRLQGVGEVLAFESLPGCGCACENRPNRW